MLQHFFLRLNTLSTVKSGINNESHTSHYLIIIGYYRLSNYFIPLEQLSAAANTHNHNIKDNADFENVLALYIFDRKLRLIVMEAIERIEVAVRTKWANALAEQTDDPHAFMQASNFKDPWSHQKQLAKVSSNLSNSREVFVTHYKEKYSSPYLPPIWAMVETLTLGELSKWLINTNDNAIKKEISQEIGLPTLDILEGVMQCISLIRNICAHHGRLWNRRIVKPLPNIKKLEGILEKEADRNQLKKELFNYLAVICHIMKTIQPQTSWLHRLSTHIQTLTPEQQAAMGFPQYWTENEFFW